MEVGVSQVIHFHEKNTHTKLDKTSKQSEFWACCAYNVGMLIVSIL